VYKHYTSKMQGSDGTSSHIPDLGTRWKWAVTFTFQLVYSWVKRPRIHFTEGWVGLRVSLDMVVIGKIPVQFGN
jgi:hypothetical protein